jgi:hypothetical protein
MKITTNKSKKVMPRSAGFPPRRLFCRGAIAAVALATASLLLAQGLFPANNHGSPVKTVKTNQPPLLDVGEAFALASSYLGQATNGLWCVSATCLEEAPNYPGLMTHWTVRFSSTNGRRLELVVLFDRTVLRREGAALVR